MQDASSSPPFAPTPLPNIGQSGKQPKGYSKTVKIEGKAVAIRGATFASSGDIASKGTGGGIISSSAEGLTKFVGPGSLDVTIEGKNVHLLGDQMLNNCGPTGTPANSATMGGILQPPLAAIGTELGIVAELEEICQALCECLAAGEHTNCVSRKLKEQDAAKLGTGTIKAEAPYTMETTPPSPCPYPGQRRPDAVVVHSPVQPPTQDNIKALVEIKLKVTRDRYRGMQKRDFELIAGDPEKLVTMSEKDCKCPDDDDGEREPVPVAKREEKKEREFKLPPWAAPVAVTMLGLAALALAVASAPAGAAVGLAAAGVAVFGNFSGEAAPGA